MATDWLDNLFSVRKVFGRVGEVVATLGDYTASLVTYDNDTSGLTAETVQDAIDELAAAPAGASYDPLTYSGTGTFNSFGDSELPGFSAASYVRFSSAPGGITINGFAEPSGNPVNPVKIIHLAVGASTSSIVHESGSAASGEQISTASEVTVTSGDVSNSGNPGTYLLLTRDATRWVATPLNVAGALTFGNNKVSLPSSAPTANYVMVSSSTSALSNVLPGTIMPRMSSSNTSTTARNFSQNRRETWNGGTAVSLTYGGVGAVDGCIETIFFPSSLGLVSFALSTDLDPTGTVAYAFDGGASAYLLTMQYFATGPCVVCSLRKVTDL